MTNNLLAIFSTLLTLGLGLAFAANVGQPAQAKVIAKRRVPRIPRD